MSDYFKLSEREFPKVSVQTKVRLDQITTAQQEQELENLLNLSFSVPMGRNFFEDFPVWKEVYKVKHGVQHLKIGAYSIGNLISSACVRIAHLKARDGKSLTIAILGGVATHPEFRGQGFAKEVVLAALHWAREQDAAAVFLWGSEYQFYRQFGFELCGQQVRLLLNSFKEINSGQCVIKNGFSPLIFNEMKKRPSGLILKDSDYFWLEAHSNVNWFSASAGIDDSQVAYAAFGRGIDLKGIVHEWGGSTHLLMELLSYLEKQFPGLELLGHPQIIQQYFPNASNFKIENQCMCLVFSPLKILHAFSKMEGPQQNQALQSFVLGHLEPEQYASFLFGSSAVRGRPSFQSSLLPFEFWIWGLDGA